MFPQIFNVNILICYEDIYKSQKHLFWASLKQYEECDINVLETIFCPILAAILDFESFTDELEFLK